MKKGCWVRGRPAGNGGYGLRDGEGLGRRTKGKGPGQSKVTAAIIGGRLRQR